MKSTFKAVRQIECTQYTCRGVLSLTIS
jgi:hypothetical protein